MILNKIKKEKDFNLFWQENNKIKYILIKIQNKKIIIKLVLIYKLINSNKILLIK
jgi:hypothetical protein